MKKTHTGQKNISYIIEGHLALLNFYESQFRSQRDAIDRWFINYLLVIGAPFPLIGSLLQLDAIKSSISTTLEYLGIIAFFFFVIGLLFLFMHIRQRINSIRFAQKISLIEKIVLSETIPNSQSLFPKFNPARFGADFWVGLVYIFINTMWLSAGIYFLLRPREGWIVGTFALGSILQAIIRSLMLRESEKKQA